MKIGCNRIWLGLLAMMAFSNSALAISTTVVISQVYSGQDIGLPGGPKARNDFVELFNRGTASVSLSGWSLQIADTASGATWRMVPLSGAIGPGQYFLIRGALRAGPGLLPAADATMAIEMPAAFARIAVIDNTTLFTASSGDCPSTAIDIVGYGSASCANGPAMDSQQSLIRGMGGCLETDGQDFVLVTPIPRNAAAPRNVCTSTPVTRSYTVPAGGGVSSQTTGAGSSLSVGYVRVQPASGSATPNGLAVFSLRQGGTLLSEATVPAAPLITSGQAYVEVSGAISTGIAIANPGDADAMIEYSFVDSFRGFPTQFGFFTVPARSQLARFLNELPFSLPPPIQGTLLFRSSAPVGVIALRGYTNERGEFLVTTLPVIDRSAPLSTDPAYLAHIAIGAGWRTEVVIIGRTDEAATGNVEFRDTSGRPLNVRIGFSTTTSVPYSLGQKSSTKLIVTGVTNDLVVGSVRIAPTNGTATPVAVSIFSNTPITGNVRVSEAGLASTRGSRFRTYVEYSGAIGAIGSIRSGLAIANTGADTATVSLSLTRLDGTSTGLTANVTVPGNGQVAQFINELFPSLAAPFQGILRVTTTSTISLVGLRARYNERNDFLITTVPSVDETASTTSAEFSFPHLADGLGFSTQFILFGGAGQASSGNLQLLTPGGQGLPAEIR